MRLLDACLVAAGLLAQPARADMSYALDQRTGEIGFAVRHLGLFQSGGHFERFNGRLDLDLQHPDRTAFTMDIVAGSLATPLAATTSMLRAPDFFDTERYPVITYRSIAVTPVGTGHYAISGVLMMRGITRPEPLEANLLVREVDAAGQPRTAEFALTGHLRRSEFGMLKDQAFVSDMVTLTIRVRVMLRPEPTKAG